MQQEALCRYVTHAKYVFGQTQVEYLDNIIGGGGFAMDPAKMCAIMDCHNP